MKKCKSYSSHSMEKMLVIEFYTLFQMYELYGKLYGNCMTSIFRQPG